MNTLVVVGVALLALSSSSVLAGEADSVPCATGFQAIIDRQIWMHAYADARLLQSAEDKLEAEVRRLILASTSQMAMDAPSLIDPRSSRMTERFTFYVLGSLVTHKSELARAVRAFGHEAAMPRADDLAAPVIPWLSWVEAEIGSINSLRTDRQMAQAMNADAEERRVIYETFVAEVSRKLAVKMVRGSPALLAAIKDRATYSTPLCRILEVRGISGRLESGKSGSIVEGATSPAPDGARTRSAR